MNDEASPEPSPASPGTDVEAGDAPEAVPELPSGDAVEPYLERAPLERRLRRVAGRKAPFRGPIVATTRGWVSRDSRWPAFAARFLDFAVLTDEHLVLCSTGFFSRRPRRQVLREPFTRLVVTPVGEPIRALRIAGDFSRAIRLELRADDEAAAFARELMARTAAERLRRAESWATTGQLGIAPPFTEPSPAELPAGAPGDATPDALDDAASDDAAADEHTAPS
jgi:hypothetical protein